MVFSDKKKLILGIVFFAVAVGIFLMQPSLSFKEENSVLEKGERYPAWDFILERKGEVTPEADLVPTDEVGTHQFHYKVKRWIFEKDVVFSYEVADTTPPHMIVKEKRVVRNSREPYMEEEMRENVLTDEGTLSFETDYEPGLSGVFTVDVRAVDDYGNESFTWYEIISEDREVPFVFRDGSGTKILRGSSFNIDRVISYGDDCDPRPVLTVEGRVNVYRVGRYPLRVKVTDASGNETEWSFTVEVVNELPKEDDYEYSYDFEDFKEEYLFEGRKLGIDVSEWQDQVDFKAVKEAGCEFVIMRIGYSYEGKLTVDKEYRRNIEEAKKAGLPVGVYLFSYDRNEEELLSSLDDVFELLGDTELELPLVFDWENFYNHFQTYGISFHELDHLYDVFKREVTARGYQSMLYGSKYYLENIWSRADEEVIWLAQYRDWPSYEDPYVFWQLSESGRIKGIETPVDLDIWFTGE